MAVAKWRYTPAFAGIILQLFVLVIFIPPEKCSLTACTQQGNIAAAALGEEFDQQKKRISRNLRWLRHIQIETQYEECLIFHTRFF